MKYLSLTAGLPYNSYDAMLLALHGTLFQYTAEEMQLDIFKVIFWDNYDEKLLQKVSKIFSTVIKICKVKMQMLRDHWHAETLISDAYRSHNTDINKQTAILRSE